MLGVLGVLGGWAGNSFAQDFESLRRQIAEGGAEEKRSALGAIRNLRTPEASRLALPALRDGDETVRATAAAAVVFLPPDEALAALAPNLGDRSAFVRRETAYALGRVRNPAAVAPLVALLGGDKMPEVRAAATVALGAIGSPAGLDALLAILRRRPRDEDEFLRRAAARAVGQIAQTAQTGDPRVTTPEDFLPEQDKTAAPKPYRNLRLDAPAFGAAVPVLLAVLAGAREADDARREAAFALGALGDSSALDALRRNVGAKDYYLAEISREAIRKIESVGR